MKNAFKEIFLSQFKIFFRERITLMITIILPLLLGTFLGLVFSRAETQDVRIIFVDEDHTDITRLMINGIIQGCKDTQLKIQETDKNDALKQLKENKTEGILIFPKDTSLSIMGTKESKVQIYYNPAQAKSMGITRLILGNIISEVNLRLNQSKKLFTVEENAVGAQEVPLANFYFPNFLAISLLWMSLFATALPLVKQREKGALVQMGVTPLSPTTFMFGTTMCRLFIGLIQCILFITAGFIALKLPVMNNLLLFILAVFIANLCLIFMGYMIAAISKSMQSAEAISQLFNFGLMFLSGIFFTREMLPDFLNKISYILPLTYIADLFRQLMTGYDGIFPLWVNFAVITGSGVIFAVIGRKFFKLFSR
ncbi:MAG: ABC transporter permease [Acidobacteria bacterium]|jgi:ABC-2 type transport system permease protein|nr:ABC transporter permease [Acidobacteriota bacterium]